MVRSSEVVALSIPDPPFASLTEQRAVYLTFFHGTYQLVSSLREMLPSHFEFLLIFESLLNPEVGDFKAPCEYLCSILDKLNSATPSKLGAWVRMFVVQRPDETLIIKRREKGMQDTIMATFM